MENSMTDYYKVLQYLRETHIDRQYPTTFDLLDGVECDCPVTLSRQHSSDHENTFKFSEVSSGDVLQIRLSQPRDYLDIDTFEVLLYSDEALTKDTLTVGFSNLKNGAVNQITLTSQDLIEEESNIPQEGGFYLFKYQVRKANTSLQKKNRKISSVYCINLNIQSDIEELYLSNLVARVDQFTVTLEDLDDYILMGKNYIMNQLLLDDFDSVPQPLQHLFFKSAGAYAWLVWWENEGKTMDDGTREGRNYATRLLDQVNAFIDKFIEANPQYNQNRIEIELLGFSKYCDYPIKRCKPKHHHHSFRRDCR